MSYDTPDGDIAYVRVRFARGPVRSVEHSWGLAEAGNERVECCFPRVVGARESVAEAPVVWREEPCFPQVREGAAEVRLLDVQTLAGSLE